MKAWYGHRATYSGNLRPVEGMIAPTAGGWQGAAGQRHPPSHRFSAAIVRAVLAVRTIWMNSLR